MASEVRLTGYNARQKYGGPIQLEGLQELRRTLSRLDRMADEPRAVPAFREALKSGADIVAKRARELAPRGTRPIPRGRSPRKRLVDMITPRVSGTTAFVRSGGLQKSPRWPRGYRYPRRIEYDGSGGNRDGYGPRAYLGPALEEKADEVARHMERFLDHIAKEWERG